MAFFSKNQPVAPDPQSPLWWLAKLNDELNGRQAQMDLMNRYYEGDHPFPFLTKAHESKIRDEFRILLRDSRRNFMGLVIDVVEERLKVEGFRLSAETDPTSDKATWDIWQANQMDAEAPAAFIEALVKGVAYLSVWEAGEGEKYPRIAVEDPTQTIVGYVPGSNYRKRAAALKVWDDDWTGMRRANVYLPEGIYKFERKEDTSGNPAGSTPAPQPAWKEMADSFVPNRLGVVPIVALRNRGRLLSEGKSELTDLVPFQNQINGYVFLQALGGYFGAHRQRWASGISLAVDEQGKPIEPFDSAVDKIWTTENPEARFGDFDATDLEGYIKSIDQLVQQLAINTRMPKHYLLPTGQEPSGDAIQSAEAGLVKKVGKKHQPFGEGLEEALRLARMFAGEADSPIDSEIVWADPQTQTVGAKVDAAIKLYAAGLLPWEAALEKVGCTQTEIQRYSNMRMTDALIDGIANPAPPAPIKVAGPIERV